MDLSKTNKQGKDINWINALKALCILFVFLRHSENYYGEDLGWFDSIFLPFYVNAFFFVSGYLLFWKQLSVPRISETRKKYLTGGGRLLSLNILFRIVIPSIIFAAIEFFPKKLIKGEAITSSDLLIETVGGCTYWFTSALVVAELLFLLLLFTRRKNIWFYAIIAFVLSALGWWLSVTEFSFIEGYGSFPWQFKHGLICMCSMASSRALSLWAAGLSCFSSMFWAFLSTRDWSSTLLCWWLPRFGPSMKAMSDATGNWRTSLPSWLSR